MKTTIHLTALMLLLAAASTCVAQTVPALVNYQGRLAGPDGAALPTGDYTLTFRVYDSATNTGGLVWGPQIFDGVPGQGHGGKIPVVQGSFNVMLGPVDTNGVSLDTAFNATNRYVEIRVRTNNPILPRQQILSAPYALNSAKLSGVDWSAVFGTNDPVNGKIPTSKLATNGTILAQQIGVGTPTPSAPLHIRSDQTYPHLEIAAGSGAIYGAFLSMDATAQPGGKKYYVYSTGGAAGEGQGKLVFQNWTDSRVIQTLTPDGNVGIGTTSPQAKLDVRGTVRVASDANSATFPTNAAFRISRADDSNKYMYMGYDSDDFGFIQSIHQTVSYRPLALNPTGGNVGIGTTTPQKKLHVNGDITLGVDSLTGGYTGLDIGLSSVSSGYAKLQAVKQSGSSFGDLILNPSGGNVGIGTASPSTTLEVAGTVTATAFNPPSDRNLKENFVAVSSREVLDKVAAIPVLRWNFIGDSTTPHLGPMAQDFHAAFGLGTDERHIATVDADGVALAAIQGLNQKLEQSLKEKDEEIQALKERLNRLENTGKY